MSLLSCGLFELDGVSMRYKGQSDRQLRSYATQPTDDPEGPRVGLLYSLSGRLAETERSIHKGALLAVNQVNAAGGIRGRQLVPVTADYASDCGTVAAKVRRLVHEDGVFACVGGYTSASRVAMLPAIHAAGSLLIYPTYFEGLETDGRTFYVGAAPNQFLVDYVRWILANLGTRLYIIGSDYVYPRTLAAIVRSMAQTEAAEVLAERYAPLGQTNFRAALEEIATLHPDVVISNIVGTDSTSAFYRQFHDAGYRADGLPIAATVTSEVDLKAMGNRYGAGHYMAATYFSSLQQPENQRYVRALSDAYGPDEVSHVAQVGAYNAVWMLAMAAERARDLSALSLREALIGTRFTGNPEGWTLTTHANHYTSHPSYIGCARPDGQFDIVAEYPVRSPDPYPSLIVPAGTSPHGHYSVTRLADPRL